MLSTPQNSSDREKMSWILEQLEYNNKERSTLYSVNMTVEEKARIAFLNGFDEALIQFKDKFIIPTSSPSVEKKCEHDNGKGCLACYKSSPKSEVLGGWEKEFDKKFDMPISEEILKRHSEIDTTKTYYDWNEIKSFIRSLLSSQRQSLEIAHAEECNGHIKKWKERVADSKILNDICNIVQKACDQKEMLNPEWVKTALEQVKHLLLNEE